MDKKELINTTRLVQRQWGLPEQSQPDWEQLRAALCLRLAELLEDDFGGLVNAMYRMDVPENKFKDALVGGTTSEIAERLADIVLNRELQRLATRRKYSKPDETNT
jgi:hypothetical protein